MSLVTSQPQEFASLLQRFFIERLMQQQNASARTVESYRDTFRMLLTYAQQVLHKPPEKLRKLCTTSFEALPFTSSTTPAFRSLLVS